MSEMDTKSYLEDELSRTRGSIKTSIALFVILTLLVVGYFQWIKTEVGPFLEPASLAEFTVLEARRNLPSVADKVGKELVASLPMVTGDAMREVVELTVPRLRKESTAWLQAQARQIAGIGTAASTVAFEEIVKAKKAELLAASGSDPGQFMVIVSLDELSRLVEIEARKQYNTLPEETLGQKLDKGAAALRNINRRLNELADGKDASRKDALSRKFISTWWTMLKQLDEPTGVAESTMGLKVKAKEELEVEGQ